MNPRTCSVIVVAMLAAAGLAEARDERLKMPIQDAMSTPAAQEQLKPGVRLYFSGQKHPAPTQQLGTFTSNKKTNFANKSDKEGCEWAFLSAAIALQERAVREGGNAVIDIHSFYKKEEFKSATEYECAAGKIMGGVALRGTVAKLP